MATRLACAVVAAMVAAVGCEEKKPVAPAAKSQPAAPVAAQPAVPAAGQRPSGLPTAGAPAEPGMLNVATIKVAIPEGWREVPVGNPMRLAELEAPGGVSVAFSTAGGDVQANLDRWANQFTGGPEAKFDQRTVGGLQVHTAEASGTFTNMAEPPRENYALRGAIVETPGAMIFIKMTGPAEAVAAADAGFNEMLNNLRPLQ